MGYFNSLPRISAISFLISQAFFTLPAFAAGFQLYETSPSLQGNATAGSAAASNDVSAMFINPATLSTLLTDQAYLGASLILPDVKMSGASAIHTVNVPGFPPSSITAPVAGLTSQRHVAQTATVPDAYFSYRYNDKLVAGLAIVAPFGLTTNYSTDSVVRFVAQNSAVRTIDLVPAIAYAYNDHLSFGAGFQAQYLKASFSNFDGPYTGIPAIDALIAANYPTNLHGHAWGYGYTLGALYNLDPCTRIGIGYRSQVSEKLHGSGEQYTSPGFTVPAPSPDFLFNGDTSVRAGVKTPAVLTLSAARDFYRWTLKGTAQINFWNSFNQLSIDMPEAFATNSTIATKWKNAWFGALGADYHWSHRWLLRGGVAFDQTPTRNMYRDPRIPDANRFWLTIGAAYQVSKRISIDGAYEHLFVPNQTVNVTQASGSSATSTVPLEVNQVYAHYRSSVDIVALAFRYNF